MIVTAPDQLREQLRGLSVGRLLERCSHLRRSSAMRADEVATRLVLRSVARRHARSRRQFRKIIGYRDLATLVIAIERDHDRRRQPDAAHTAHTPSKEAATVAAT